MRSKRQRGLFSVQSCAAIVEGEWGWICHSVSWQIKRAGPYTALHWTALPFVWLTLLFVDPYYLTHPTMNVQGMYNFCTDSTVPSRCVVPSLLSGRCNLLKPIRAFRLMRFSCLLVYNRMRNNCDWIVSNFDCMLIVLVNYQCGREGGCHGRKTSIISTIKIWLLGIVQIWITFNWVWSWTHQRCEKQWN